MRRAEGIASDAVPAFQSVLDELSTDWPPLIERVRQLQAESFGLTKGELRWGARRQVRTFGDEEDLTSGEVFIVPDGLVVLSLRDEESGDRIRFRQDADGTIVPILAESKTVRLTASALTHGNPTDLFDAIQRAVGAAMSVTLDEHRFTNERFESLRHEVVSEDLPNSPDARRAAHTLLERNARSLAVAIKSSRGLLVGDAGRHLAEGADSAPVLARLVAAGLATMEVVVVCTASGQQVARVPDKGSLTKLARAGLRCACGNAIDQESPSDLYSITDVGTLLLDKSRWMSVLVRERLEQLGVPSEDILLECQLGGDEIDCLALVSGEIALFELKDKEFSVGNAYSFGAKMSVVRPKHAVIVTTEFVSGQVKDHFSRTNTVEPARMRLGRESETLPVHYIEGSEFLNGLDPIVGKIYSEYGRRLVDEALALGVARGESLIDALQAQPLVLKSPPVGGARPRRPANPSGGPKSRS